MTYAPVSAAEHLAGYGWSIRPYGETWAWFATGRNGRESGQEATRGAAQVAAREAFEGVR